MKPLCCIGLLLLGSVGYDPPRLVTLTLWDGSVLNGVMLEELAGDSIRVDGDHWIHLGRLTTLVDYQLAGELEVTTKDKKHYMLDDWSVREDGTILGTGHLLGYHEMPFAGSIPGDDIESVANEPADDLLAYAGYGAGIGFLAGCAFAYGNPRYGWLDLVVGTVLGGAAGMAASGGFATFSDSTPGIFDLSGAPLGAKREVIRNLLRGGRKKAAQRSGSW